MPIAVPHERIVLPVLTAGASGVIALLAARPSVQVIAVAMDVGQGAALDELRDVALAAGALRCHVFDLRTRLAERFLWPALRAGALGVSGEPVVVALTAPCVAEAVVDVARLEHATAVAAHASDPRERQRLHAAMRALAAGLGVVAIPSTTGATANRNLWARVEALGPDAACPQAVGATSGQAAHVTVRIEHGLPVALSGVPLPPAELIDSLATIARSHGISGTVVVDARGRWLVDAPAAVVLERTCATLSSRRFDDDVADVALRLGGEYAGLVRDGRWFSPLREGIDAFMTQVLVDASGEVTVTFDGGRIEVHE